jgi:hypothetical protein
VAAVADEGGGTYTRTQLLAIRGGIAARCESCGERMPPGRHGVTCSPECSRYRERLRNRERAKRWRDNARDAMAGALQVFGDNPEPPPMAWLHVLATVPAGCRLTLALPDGSTVSWSRP